jgi:hypothetical protein
MASDYFRPRRVRCDSTWCESYGREWTLHPRHVEEGLYAWDAVLCVGCGCSPVLPPSTTAVDVDEAHATELDRMAAECERLERERDIANAQAARLAERLAALTP